MSSDAFASLDSILGSATSDGKADTTPPSVSTEIDLLLGQGYLYDIMDLQIAIASGDEGTLADVLSKAGNKKRVLDAIEQANVDLPLLEKFLDELPET